MSIDNEDVYVSEQELNVFGSFVSLLRSLDRFFPGCSYKHSASTELKNIWLA